ncbi:MAG: hypothetical protein LBL69_03085 [Zoogloeaceae bacterium]|jgi:hypothetical protein|nr:hypothetical protein [Zoogloeaceae bacterium]
MDSGQSLSLLWLILSREATLIEEVEKAVAVQKLHESRNDFLQHLRAVGNSADLALLVATEKAVIEGDLNRYTNSKAMESSLKSALQEFEAIERLLRIMDDRAQYAVIAKAHSLPKRQEKGLPLDEAREAFKSHIARLSNLDKARLSDTEKALIDARKANMQVASKLYILRQAKTLGVDGSDA